MHAICARDRQRPLKYLGPGFPKAYCKVTPHPQVRQVVAKVRQAKVASWLYCPFVARQALPRDLDPSPVAGDEFYRKVVQQRDVALQKVDAQVDAFQLLGA